MKYLQFTRVEDKVYADKQLVPLFFISDELVYRGECEVRPLTIGHLLRSLVRNHTRIAYWSLARALYKSGFLNPPLGASLNWRKDWRWDFYNVLDERRNAARRA